jgi:chromosomal replication initiation ATPase DnaA
VSAREFTEEELELAAHLVFEPRLRIVRPTLHAVAQAIAAEHALPVAALLGPSRLMHISHARQALYAALRARGLSLPAIGRFMGRDHTTVLYGIQAHRDRLVKAGT